MIFYIFRYLLYDVNLGEGFNLRRDVYIRIANLVRKLIKTDNWVLVCTAIICVFVFSMKSLEIYKIIML